MPIGEYKVMVIKIFTGLKKRVKDLSETLNKETENIKKKNQSERTQLLKLKTSLNIASDNKSNVH